MKKGKLLIICIALSWLIAGPAFAQEIDQNTHFISGNEHTDVSNYIKRARQLQYQQPDSALTLANKALTLARNESNNRDISLALTAVGGVLYNSREMKVKESKRYFLEALGYAISLPESDESLPKLYNCIATCLLSEPDYDSASYYYFKGLNLLDKYKSKDTIAYISLYKGLSTLFGYLGNVDQSRIYSQKLHALALSKGNTTFIADSYFSIGLAYANRRHNNDLDTALNYLHTALPLYKKVLKDPQGLIRIYDMIGTVFLLRDELDAAQMYYDSAIAVNRDLAMSNSGLLKEIGLLEINTGNYKKALYYLNKGLELSIEKKRNTDREDIYSQLAIVNARLGDYKNAFQYQQKYSLLHDSIVNENKINTVSQLELKYRTSEKDKELTQKSLQLALAQGELNKNRNIYISLVGGGLILIIAFIAFIQKQRLQLQRANITRQKQKTDQLKAAIDSEEKEKSRIGRQLHDDIMVELSIVKMGLSALPMNYPEIKNTNNYRNLVEQLDNTSRKLRQTAHNLMPDVLLEEGLVPAVSYFCNNIKKMTGLQVRFQYYGTIPRMEPDKEVNIYRIIQELLQNIIKHAHAKNVLVQLNYYDKVLSITVEDDGVGFDINQIAPGAAMGLKSIQTRIKAIEGNIEFYPRTPHGTSVNIAFPA